MALHTDDFDIRSVLSVVQNDVKHTKEQMDDFIETYKIDRADHEIRLRFVEKKAEKLGERLSLLTVGIGILQGAVLILLGWLKVTS